ncbi:hypothetical protein LTR95_000766 [Oleoguttula sp. CCFEE 5521]
MATEADRQPELESWPAYQYSPVAPDEIRLVTLLPGAFDDEIHVNIHHRQRPRPTDVETVRATIDHVRDGLIDGWSANETLGGRVLFLGGSLERQWQHPVTGEEMYTSHVRNVGTKYEALSYTWGEDPDEECVTVETGAGINTLSIRENLAIALRHVRRAGVPRDLWIDALCIDQSNSAERGQQVQHMHHIFQLADQVIIWLGVAADDSAHAISTLRYLAAQVEVAVPDYRSFPAPDCVEPTWYHPRVPLPYDERTVDSIAALLLRPWFDRLWVVQEVKLANARSVMLCGSDEILVPDFVVATGALEERDSMPDDWKMRTSYVNTNITPLRHCPFIRELARINFQDCNDLRDKVYGTLGIAPLSVRDMIKPDYEVSVEQVYHDASVAITRCTNRADVLMHCRPANRRHGLPSWVVDWSDTNFTYMTYVQQAAGMSRSRAEFSEWPLCTMVVHAVRCGVVGIVGDTATRDFAKAPATLRQWHNACADAALQSGTGFDLDLFVKTMAFGVLQDRLPGHGYSTLADARELMNELVALDPEVAMSPDLTKASVTPFRRPFRVFPIEGMRMFRTACGLVGLMDGSPKVCDILCVVLGCPTPVIIRANDLPSASYEVVGPCYVAGLMDADALLGDLSKDWTFICEKTNGSRSGMQYHNLPTGFVTDEDPRLPPLPLPWVRLDRPLTSADPYNVSWYLNTETREEINGDPRLEPDALRARGVELERITLV